MNSVVEFVEINPNGDFLEIILVGKAMSEPQSKQDMAIIYYCSLQITAIIVASNI